MYKEIWIVMGMAVVMMIIMAIFFGVILSVGYFFSEAWKAIVKINTQYPAVIEISSSSSEISNIKNCQIDVTSPK